VLLTSDLSGMRAGIQDRNHRGHVGVPDRIVVVLFVGAGLPSLASYFSLCALPLFPLFFCRATCAEYLDAKRTKSPRRGMAFGPGYTSLRAEPSTHSVRLRPRRNRPWLTQLGSADPPLGRRATKTHSKAGYLTRKCLLVYCQLPTASWHLPPPQAEALCLSR